MGVGFDAWIADAFASSACASRDLHSRRSGRISALRAERYQIDVNGETLERKALLIAIANASQYGKQRAHRPIRR